MSFLPREALRPVEWSISVSPDEEPLASIHLEQMQRDGVDIFDLVQREAALTGGH